MKREQRRLSLCDPAVLLALLLLAAWLLSGRTAMAGAMPEGEVTRGSLILHTGQGEAPAPLLHTDVRMEVSGLLARVRLSQRFRNPGGDWAEAVYVFPLPENAAVDHLRMRIGERVIEGRIQEKEQARKTYEQAKREGRRASLVSQQRPNIFTTSLANIGPGEEVTVEIEYQQTLRYADGAFRLRFPMVVGPRYIPGTPVAAADRIDGFGGDGWAMDTDQVPDASRITPPVRHPDAGPVNPVSLGIDLNAGFPLAEVRSSYHAVREERLDDQHRRIVLAEGEVPADRDFELVWRPQAGREPSAAWFRETGEESDYGMLMLMPPVGEVEKAMDSPRDLVFVIDVSGSMHGTSMEQARQALLLALERLGPQDRFNLIAFNQSARQLFPVLQPGTSERLRIARSYVRSLRAEGGTEMLSALKMSMTQGDEGSALRQIVFLTDGSVGNEEALFAAIRDGLGDSRLFTVGIGSAPNSHFMARAAEHGRGTFTYIGDTGEVNEKMQALFRKLEHPALTDIAVETEGGDALESYPQRIPDLYRGEPVMLVWRAKRLPDAVTIRGRHGEKDWSTRMTLDGGQDRKGIGVAWARRRIADLEGKRQRARDEQSRASLRQELVDTALRHHLVSAHTSLVAVDLTPARSREALLKRHALETDLPHGWSHEHVFGTAKTATPAPLQLLIGLLLLMLAAVLGLCWKDHERPVWR